MFRLRGIFDWQHAHRPPLLQGWWSNIPPAAGGVLGHAHRRRCGRWVGGVLDYTAAVMPGPGSTWVLHLLLIKEYKMCM